jgi:hypothetical protein
MKRSRRSICQIHMPICRTFTGVTGLEPATSRRDRPCRRKRRLATLGSQSRIPTHVAARSERKRSQRAEAACETFWACFGHGGPRPSCSVARVENCPRGGSRARGTCPNEPRALPPTSDLPPTRRRPCGPVASVGNKGRPPTLSRGDGPVAVAGRLANGPSIKPAARPRRRTPPSPSRRGDDGRTRPSNRGRCRNRGLRSRGRTWQGPRSPYGRRPLVDCRRSVPARDARRPARIRPPAGEEPLPGEAEASLSRSRRRESASTHASRRSPPDGHRMPQERSSSIGFRFRCAFARQR